MKKMHSKYNGTCKGCGGHIQRGELIAWSKKAGAFHSSCAPSRDSRADREYWEGRAQGNRYISDKQIYGQELADQWALEDELAAYNRGDIG